MKLAKISIYMVNVLSQSEYHDLLVPIYRDHLGVAVWLTGMVDEPRLVARHCGIHHFIVIDTEHVTTNALESVKREEGRQRRWGRWREGGREGEGRGERGREGEEGE